MNPSTNREWDFRQGVTLSSITPTQADSDYRSGPPSSHPTFRRPLRDRLRSGLTALVNHMHHNARRLLQTLMAMTLTMCVGIAAAADANFQSGVKAYIAGHYDDAAKIWTPLADQGHTDAMYYLGQMHIAGPLDDSSKAVDWFRRAAALNHTPSQIALGLAYADGRGVSADPFEAQDWLGKAAEAGNSRAQFYLGRLYTDGKTMQVDTDKARGWLSRSAKQGDLRARALLRTLDGKTKNGVRELGALNASANKSLAALARTATQTRQTNTPVTATVTGRSVTAEKTVASVKASPIAASAQDSVAALADTQPVADSARAVKPSASDSSSGAMTAKLSKVMDADKNTGKDQTDRSSAAPATTDVDRASTPATDQAVVAVRAPTDVVPASESDAASVTVIADEEPSQTVADQATAMPSVESAIDATKDAVQPTTVQAPAVTQVSVPPKVTTTNASDLTQAVSSDVVVVAKAVSDKGDNAPDIAANDTGADTTPSSTTDVIVNSVSSSTETTATNELTDSANTVVREAVETAQATANATQVAALAPSLQDTQDSSTRLPALGNADDAEDLQWLSELGPDRYTIQLYVTSDRVSAQAFIDRHSLTEARFFKQKSTNASWYKIIIGSYTSTDDARQARSQLSADLQRYSPWVRSFDSVQRELGIGKDVAMTEATDESTTATESSQSTTTRKKVPDRIIVPVVAQSVPEKITVVKVNARDDSNDSANEVVSDADKPNQTVTEMPVVTAVSSQTQSSVVATASQAPASSSVIQPVVSDTQTAAIDRDTSDNNELGAKLADRHAIDQIAYRTGQRAYNRRDYSNAMGLWEPLAEAGYADAQYGVGFMYEAGWGVERNVDRAHFWYTLAAQQGYAKAQYQLGMLYLNGNGVPQDETIAAYWIQSAADQYDTRAAAELLRLRTRTSQ